MSGTGRAGLLLDLGKVLLDLDFNRFRARIQSLTEVEERDLRSVLTSELAHRYETGGIGERRFYREFCAGTRCRISWIDFVECWNGIFDPDPVLDPVLLERLQSKGHMWILSNTNSLHFRFILGRHRWLDLFQGFVLSHEVGALKPDPRVFEIALRRMQIPTDRVLFVDDRLPNVHAAEQLGIGAFQYLNRSQFQEEMQERGWLD